MSTTTAADLPTPDINQLLVNLHTALSDFLRGIRSLSDDELSSLMPELETLTHQLSGIYEYSKRVTQLNNSSGQLRTGCIVIKLVNNCGPYGYLVTSTGGGKRSWKYLGKADKGTSSGVYSPGTAMRFKTKEGWNCTGNEDEIEGGETSL